MKTNFLAISIITLCVTTTLAANASGNDFATSKSCDRIELDIRNKKMDISRLTNYFDLQGQIYGQMVMQNTHEGLRDEQMRKMVQTLEEKSEAQSQLQQLTADLANCSSKRN